MAKYNPKRNIHAGQQEQKQKNQQASQKNTFRKPGSSNTRKNLTDSFLEPGKKAIALGLLAVALLTFILYLPALKNSMTKWDDEPYVAANKYVDNLSSKNLNDIFFGDGKYIMGNYHPLSILSLAIDNQIGKSRSIQETGKNSRKGYSINKFPDFEPWIFHLTNIIIHLINTLLVFWFIFLLLKNFWIAIIAAALFGVNALHVESVAWIAERKDVLYTMFFLLSLIAYLKYLKELRIWYFLLSLFLFLLSLLSKGQAVSLTLSLVLIDYFAGRRLLSMRVLLEKLPFFILSVIFGLIAIKAQQVGNAIGDITDFPIYVRAVFAAHNLVKYLFMLLVPVNLAALYFYPPSNQPIPFYYYLYLIPFLLLVAIFIYSLRRDKKIVFGLAFYAVNIFFQLQLLPVGSAIMADRYSYIPSIGFSMILAYGFYYLFKNKASLRPLLLGGLTVYLVFLSVLTNGQIKMWKDDLSIWDQTIKISPGSHLAWLNLGAAKRDVNRFEDAVEDCNNAVRLNAKDPKCFMTRGGALRELNRNKEAIEDFTRALQLEPTRAQAFNSRAVSEERLNMQRKALEDYGLAIKYDSLNTDYLANRGRLYGKMSILDSSLIDLNRAIRLAPGKEDIITTRGTVYFLKGEYEKADADFTKSLSLNPNSLTVYANRAKMRMNQKNYPAAVQDFTDLLKITPNTPDAYLNRGLARRNLKDSGGSFEDYGMAIQLKPDYGSAYYQRAMLGIESKQLSKVCDDLQNAKKYGISGLEGFIAQYCR